MINKHFERNHLFFFINVGRARPAIVWDAYNEGCSIRILNPHSYSDSVWKLLSCLQEYFGSLVGANTYLTPPGSQGFAPHYGTEENHSNFIVICLRFLSFLQMISMLLFFN